MTPQIRIAALRTEDRDAWERLARGYKAFYQTETSEAEFERAWQRLLAQDGVFGLGAHVDAEMVGIAHYLFHTTVWAPRACYLQDLFTAPASRGQGVARALIVAVAQAAVAAGAARYYWLTQDCNHSARRLYDRVARFNGFIRYEHPMPVVLKTSTAATP
jgi:GNAT superfamily N-acetyltransferase